MNTQTPPAVVLSTALLAENVNWKRKWYMGFDYCPKCPSRFSQHGMNCIECCPVKRGEVQANAAAVPTKVGHEQPVLPNGTNLE